MEKQSCLETFRN
jgi:dynein heavy chain, axonemal